MNAQSSVNKTKSEKIREILAKYREAGQISIEAKKLARKIIKPGTNVFTTGQQVEQLIRDKGAKPAFPINISIDNEAAHYSPEILDKRVIPQNSIVKVDLGVEIDGYLVDTAITLNFNDELEELSNISAEALDAIINMAKPGTKLIDIGKKVEKIITDAGYNPVRNLSGHQIKRYNLHAGVSIPNTGPSMLERTLGKLQAGKIYAVEPFASTGKGWVKNGKRTNIFRFIGFPTGKNQELRKIANEYKLKVGILPFSPRHVWNPETGEEGKEEVKLNLRKLLRAKTIMGYPVLVDEDSNGMVSQHEHTLRMTKSGCEVLTSNEY